MRAAACARYRHLAQACNAGSARDQLLTDEFLELNRRGAPATEGIIEHLVCPAGADVDVEFAEHIALIVLVRADIPVFGIPLIDFVRRNAGQGGPAGRILYGGAAAGIADARAIVDINIES